MPSWENLYNPPTIYFFEENEGEVIVPQGWQCPLCDRIFSPNIDECIYCNEETNE